jgi:hypothetical protein
LFSSTTTAITINLSFYWDNRDNFWIFLYERGTTIIIKLYHDYIRYGIFRSVFWQNLKSSYGQGLLTDMSEKGMFVFPTHQQVWDHNKVKLLKVNQSYPIAKLSAISKCVHGNSTESDLSFYWDNRDNFWIFLYERGTTIIIKLYHDYIR